MPDDAVTQLPTQFDAVGDAVSDADPFCVLARVTLSDDGGRLAPIDGFSLYLAHRYRPRPRPMLRAARAASPGARVSRWEPIDAWMARREADTP